MTRINLLPWREQHLKEKNIEFGIVMALCMALAAGVGFGGFKFFDEQVAFQQKRNKRLDTEIALLQEELKEIQTLEETKNNLLARMEIIQQLQGQRPQIVHTFQEVATRLPDGIFLTKMRQEGEDKLILEGLAESNARVSALMRRMDRSDYFRDPRLDVIKADEDDFISAFTLSVTQTRPKSETESENNGI